MYKLKPNTTYEFRIWATNQLGKGEITEVLGTTLNSYPEQGMFHVMRNSNLLF